MPCRSFGRQTRFSSTSQALWTVVLPPREIDEGREPVYETTTDAELSGKVLWAAVRGSASPPPPGQNASPAEHERAVLVWSMLSAHESVRASLAKSGDG